MYPDGANQYRNFTIPSFESSNQVKPSYDQLHINEILASNNNDTLDVNGDNEDWIEIYNSGNQTVNLGGYFLSDDIANPTKWKIPVDNSNMMEINNQSFALFFADNDTQDGKMHLPFKLSKAGETLQLNFLDDQTMVLIDELTFAAQEEDVSFGRFPDGDNNTVHFEITTPNYTNFIDVTGFNELTENIVSMYPNPVSANLYIKNNFVEPTNFSIVSATGQTLVKGTIRSPKHTINLDHLASNIYLLKIGATTYKIIKN
jgi:hypothetical protein